MISIDFDPTIKHLKQPSIVFLTKEQINDLSSLHFDKILEGQVRSICNTKKFSAESGEIFPLLVNDQTILIVGLGEPAKISKTSLCASTKQALESTLLSQATTVHLFPHDKSAETILPTIEGILIGRYRWKKYIQQKKDQKILSMVVIAAPANAAYLDHVKVCDGVNYTRDLVNDNADVVSAPFLENELKRIVRGKKNITLQILGEKELKKHKLDLLLAVNKASQYPPRLLIARYQGLKKDAKYIALVGKGITFDTGGLNLKPTGSIETMRGDMAGASAILGVLKNCIALNIKQNVLFVMAIAENAIGSKAFKPGDVVRSYSGKTIEIANTDAEGRLVLADAIAFVIKNYKIAKIIDIATLTGACPVALGNDYSGLMSNDEALADKLLTISKITDDRLWRLPLYPELKVHLKSQYADLKSTGMPRGIGGTISAAEFLHQFVGETNWAHLDIAGTSFAEAQGRLYYNYGATGAGVRLLTEFVKSA